MVSRDSRRRCLFFSNSINLFVDWLFVVSTPEITIFFRLGGAAIVGWRGQSIKKRTTHGSVISNARFLKLYKKFLKFTSDVGSSGDRRHTAPEWCQPDKLVTLSFSAFLVVCDQDKKPHIVQQILKGGNFCQLTSLLLHHNISLKFIDSSQNHCCPT